MGSAAAVSVGSRVGSQIAKPEELNLEEDGRRQSRKGLRKGKGQGRVTVS